VNRAELVAKIARLERKLDRLWRDERDRPTKKYVHREVTAHVISGGLPTLGKKR